MDTLRGTFDSGLPADDSQSWEAANDTPEEETVRELPPEEIGKDERRMQVRAYNHWASLLGDATYPSIEYLEPHNLTDFAPNSVLLDFTAGVDDPAVQYLGDKLAQECGAEQPIQKLSDVPPRSLLSRITDHYMQILANQAPIGFEAEFVNQQGVTILYRGILLPFSSDDEAIDFIYGVINWKEMADAATADELLLEIDQALEQGEPETDFAEDQPQKHHSDTLVEWADSPAFESEGEGSDDGTGIGHETDNVTALAYDDDQAASGDDLPMPDFGQYALDEPEFDEFGDEIEEEDENSSSYSFASLADYIEAPAKKAVDLEADHFDPEDYRIEEAEFEAAVSEPEPNEPETYETGTNEPSAFDEPERAPVAEASSEPLNLQIEHAPDAGLYDCLASARALAETARVSEDRSRQALYAAVGRAYDFSLAAQREPDAYHELIEDHGLTVQERAPLTPIVKLVFGHDYDKTRVTEYACVLNHAHRMELESGTLAEYLSNAEGGLKGVINAERRLRREESGAPVDNEAEIRAKLAKKLRQLEELTLETLAGDGPEFSLVMVRRDQDGRPALIGEINDDKGLIERVGKRLVR